MQHHSFAEADPLSRESGDVESRAQHDLDVDASDSLTVLTTIPDRAGRWPVATKTLGRAVNGEWRKKDFRAGTFFCLTEHPVNGVESLHSAIVKLSERPNSFVIRGATGREIAPGETVRRRLADKHPDDR